MDQTVQETQLIMLLQAQLRIFSSALHSSAAANHALSAESLLRNALYCKLLAVAQDDHPRKVRP